MPEFKVKGYMSSGLLDASAAVKAAAGTLGGIICIHDGTNDPTITLDDDPDSADGTRLFYFKEDVSAGIAADGLYQHFFRLPDVPFSLGCYLTLTGTNAKAIVYYR